MLSVDLPASACLHLPVPVQVIEFFANGLAQESFVPRTAQELGLHPRDVTLFAPLSRLAAPQVCGRLCVSAV